MSGITHGSRLDQLLALRDRVALEIEAERARLATDDTQQRTTGRPAPTPEVMPDLATDHLPTRERLERLGVTTHDVKAWGVEQGHLDYMARGAVAAWVVDLYEAAHPTTQEEPA